MPETRDEWFDRVNRVIAEGGARRVKWAQWPTWPFEGETVPKLLEPPTTEPERGGASGVDCQNCELAKHLPAETVLWYDDLWFLTWAEGQALPFGAFLMPRRHADLSDLTTIEAQRGGQLLVLVEQAAVATLDIPRMQVARWGDGAEHMHWWLYARPTGMLQLRGTFLSHWDDILPVRDPAEHRSDMVLVARALQRTAGGHLSPR